MNKNEISVILFIIGMLIGNLGIYICLGLGISLLTSGLCIIFLSAYFSEEVKNK